MSDFELQDEAYLYDLMPYTMDDNALGNSVDAVNNDFSVVSPTALLESFHVDSNQGIGPACLDNSSGYNDVHDSQTSCTNDTLCIDPSLLTRANAAGGSAPPTAHTPFYFPPHPLPSPHPSNFQAIQPYYTTTTTTTPPIPAFHGVNNFALGDAMYASPIPRAESASYHVQNPVPQSASSGQTAPGNWTRQADVDHWGPPSATYDHGGISMFGYQNNLMTPPTARLIAPLPQRRIPSYGYRNVVDGHDNQMRNMAYQQAMYVQQQVPTSGATPGLIPPNGTHPGNLASTTPYATHPTEYELIPSSAPNPPVTSDRQLKPRRSLSIIYDSTVDNAGQGVNSSGPSAGPPAVVTGTSGTENAVPTAYPPAVPAPVPNSQPQKRARPPAAPPLPTNFYPCPFPNCQVMLDGVRNAVRCHIAEAHSPNGDEKIVCPVGSCSTTLMLKSLGSHLVSNKHWGSHIVQCTCGEKFTRSTALDRHIKKGRPGCSRQGQQPGSMEVARPGKKPRVN